MAQSDGGPTMGRLQASFESGLWHSRWLALVAVAASLAVAVAICIVATVDVFWLLVRLSEYFGAVGEPREALRQVITGEAVKALDSYLLAVILLIFSLGIYELFIDKLEIAEGSLVASRLLLIRNLDDLKHRLANVVILKLLVTFFQAALKLHYETAADLLCLAGGIALLGLALYLTARGHGDAGAGHA